MLEYNIIAQTEFEMDYDKLDTCAKEWVRDTYDIMQTKKHIHMEFTQLELELMRYAMYDLLNQDGNQAVAKCEQIIAKIDKMVNNIK